MRSARRLLSALRDMVRRQMAALEVSNEQLRTVREAMRQLTRLVDALAAGEADKFVLCQSTQMRAVLVSVETYARLTEAASLAQSAQHAA
jgi:prefoldin subunit 5